MLNLYGHDCTAATIETSEVPAPSAPSRTTSPLPQWTVPILAYHRVGDPRREEIARLLSGARITDAARAAADSLIAGGAR